MVPLSMLCQSPVSAGRSAAQAIADTVALAQVAEASGYKRFWVTEHHSDNALACGAPAVLVAHIAALTKRIRVGSGGVLLPFHAPFHIAEQFNLLAALHPGRIDLGVGRGGGSEGHAPSALGVRTPASAAFQALDELQSWLGEGSSRRPFLDTHASPGVTEAAKPFVLGTSPGSATEAAKRGLPYVFGGFLDPRGLMASLGAYHQSFRSVAGSKPHTILAWYAQIGESKGDAEHEATSTSRWFVNTLLRGRNPAFAPPAPLDGLSPMEQMAVAMRQQATAMGTPAEVAGSLRALAKQTAVDEVMVISICHDPDKRRWGYAELAGAWS